MSEEWRPVAGHPGYEVSDLGRTRNVKTGRVHAPRPNADGYVTATFGRSDRAPLHRVVLTTFLGYPEPGQEASHLNDDRADNRLANLLWETHGENIARKREHGTLIQGERVNTARLTERDVRDIRRLGALGWTATRIAARGWFPATRESISNVLRRKTWRHVA